METAAPKKNWQIAAGVFGRTAIAALIGALLYLSISMVFTTLGTEVDGFAIYKENGDGTTTLVSEHHYSDPDYTEDMELPDGHMVITLYTPMPADVALIGDIVALIGSLIILVVFPYRFLWNQGYSDRNGVNRGYQTEDKLRGLKVGLLANIPAMAVYLLLWLGKLGVPLLAHKAHSLYTLFNSSVRPFTYRVMGRNLQSATDLSVGQLLLLVLPVLVLPVMCHLAYRLGHREFILSDKVFYKNKKKKHRHR